jgi:hypothetical protein
VLLAVGTAVLYFAYQYYANVKVFRYRLTMEIEADGKLHSASSIIEVKYIIGYDGLKNWNTRVRGVAPMIDLGPHGTIIAAFDYQGDDYARKERAAGRRPKSIWEINIEKADSLPLSVYKLHPKEINSAIGRVILQKYPCIVWVPAGDNWRAAQQLFPDELQTVVHRSVRILQMTVEPARWASVLTLIDPAPEWVKTLRTEQQRGVSTPVGKYVLNLSRDVERNGW